MSPESNVDVVKKFVDAFNRRDMDAIVDNLHAEVELHEWPDAPGTQSYRGPEGVQQALDNWFDVWEWMQVTIEDVVEEGDRVLISFHHRAKGKGSEVEVETDSHNVYTLDGGKVTRMELFIDREQALAAFRPTANLEEEKR
jgi:ketosteroid isomerase-like protein